MKYRIDIKFYRNGIKMARSIWADSALDAIKKANRAVEIDFPNQKTSFDYYTEKHHALMTYTIKVPKKIFLRSKVI